MAAELGEVEGSFCFCNCFLLQMFLLTARALYKRVLEKERKHVPSEPNTLDFSLALDRNVFES
jgi:hypothetical protein